MALTDSKKTELIKKIIIKRIKNIGSYPTLKTFIKNLTWIKVKKFLKDDIQERADTKGLEGADSLIEEFDLIEFKDDIDGF